MPSSPAAHNPSLDASSDEETAVPNHGDLSQACFLLHLGGSKPLKNFASTIEQSPKKTAPFNKRKRTAKQDVLPSTLPPCLADEPQECGVWRMEAFQSTWKGIEDNIKEVFEAHNTKVFKEIQKFVHNALFYDAQLELYLSSKTSKSGAACASARVTKQLHAALLHLRNVDSSDHMKTFVQLKTHLKKNDCYVANLLPHSFSSKSGVGVPLHSMIKQIVGISPDTADMDVLASWHRQTLGIKCPIVIIIEDAELCSATVLAEFIVILSEWIVELPLVLVMGMATSGEAFRKLLPGSAARHLHVHNFMFPSPNEYLEGIIKGVLLKPSPLFTLGGDPLHFLLIQYKKYDSTVTSFLRALKMACMEHFVSQPLSFFCATLPDAPIQTLKGTLLQYATTLPSLQSKQFNNDDGVGKEMAMALSKLMKRKEQWNATILCLLTASNLLGLDSVKIFSEILEQQIHHTVVHHKSVAMNGDILQLAQNSDSNATTILLKKLRDAPEPTMHKMVTKWIELTESLKEWRAEAQNLLHKLALESPSVSSGEGVSNSCNGSSRAKQLLLSVEETCEERQENMTSNVEVCGLNMSRQKGVSMERAPVDSEFDPPNVTRVLGAHGVQKMVGLKIHGKIAASLLERMMREYLIPIESLPFHEIICYRNVAAIKQVLVGEPRKVIQWNVEHPLRSLKCECCCLNNGDLSGSMNDNSILFHLVRRNGDQANLFDLYQAFSTILTGPISEKQAISKKGQHKSPKKIAKVDRTLVQYPLFQEAVVFATVCLENLIIIMMRTCCNGWSWCLNLPMSRARFCKAASELQLVGLFRMASKKRSESVQLAI